ncbi:MAG: flavin reductase (DIM6/NTAB) family NADH-FMN oxidoreductase RutF [Gammaproteobacteria bacterium]|jgi:flavin reductase (DIM6/NTAB) family NADH-FMN oxidoreductase RutF
MFYNTDKPHGLPHDPFKSCVTPRPIAWVSTMGADGQCNLAPYSFFNALSSDPPTVIIGFNGYHEHGGDKDTLRNIKETGEFVVNIVPLELKDAMNTSTTNYPHDVNEIVEAKLTTEPSELVKPPRIAEAPIHLECTLHELIKLPCTLENSSNTAVLGLVAGVHIRDDILNEGLIDLSRVKPLARLGYMQYTAVDEIFSMRRPG